VEKALGRFSGDTAYDVRFALDREAAFYAREEPWHASQQLVERPDGRVELTMRVNGLVDARNLAIRWGEHVEVLSPPELREDVRQTLKAALQSYGGA
jgi:proteasome accessory factor B